jgi:uncharacterized protein YndB with AHSA1/START domain
MYRFSTTIDIDAPPARVWRALCVPAEVVQWDSGVVEPIDAPADYPQPGQYVRWRYANGPFKLLHDRPQEVVPERTLRSIISLGPTSFDETYTLEPLDSGCRLTAAMEIHVPWWLLGPLASRRYVGPESKRAVEKSLHAIKAHCEAKP